MISKPSLNKLYDNDIVLFVHVPSHSIYICIFPSLIKEKEIFILFEAPSSTIYFKRLLLLSHLIRQNLNLTTRMICWRVAR